MWTWTPTRMPTTIRAWRTRVPWLRSISESQWASGSFRFVCGSKPPSSGGRASCAMRRDKPSFHTPWPSFFSAVFCGIPQERTRPSARGVSICLFFPCYVGVESAINSHLTVGCRKELEDQSETQIWDASPDRQPKIQSSSVEETLQRIMVQTNNDCRFRIFILTSSLRQQPSLAGR